ncbi:hypothetical protein RGQ29_027382 [Quercus rubra]|uniref:Uncharacterized protein n=1 Tax=Quercus rubra TaxID=3512 RepID=A0AAN7EQ73_QUERU|nr:hypothetical protein RGQ29_027382 [Quercus rubra]
MVAFRNLALLYLNSFLPGCLLCHIITSILSRRFGPLQTLIPSESSNVLLLSLST